MLLSSAGLLSWRHGERRLALALDATSLSDRFVAPVVSVLSRGCAIPVAWKVLSAHRREAWRPHWKRLLGQIADGIPGDWFVLVLADRGLYARWLYQDIRHRGRRPFLRIHCQARFRLPDRPYQPLATLLTGPGMPWSERVIGFNAAPLTCTLLIAWTTGKVIVTDLPPDHADAAW